MNHRSAHSSAHNVIAFPVQDRAPRIVFGRALIRRLAELAAELTGATFDDIMFNRKWQFAWTRFAVMQVAREHGKSTSQIGRVLGGLDHSTVITGSRRALVFEAEDPDYARLMALLRAEAVE